MSGFEFGLKKSSDERVMSNWAHEPVGRPQPRPNDDAEESNNTRQNIQNSNKMTGGKSLPDFWTGL